MARSLNKAALIGNLTRDPELRYTPQGTAVCTFGLATNRSWVTDAGEKKEEAEFHRIVSWNKLAELCSQLLTKGRKVYVEGRLSNRSWTGQDGAQRTTTEIVISDMIILDSRREREEETGEIPDLVQESPPQAKGSQDSKAKKTRSGKSQAKKGKDESPSEKTAGGTPTGSEDINPDDIPF